MPLRSKIYFLNNYMTYNEKKFLYDNIMKEVSKIVKKHLNESIFDCGLDIVVIARSGAKGKTCQEIESALLHLMRKHHVAGKNNGEYLSAEMFLHFFCNLQIKV